MTKASDLLVDGMQRVRETVHDVVGDLDSAALTARLDPEANTIAWLVWHLTRVADDHVADVAGTRQVWHDGWADRLGLPFDPDDHGYGHSSEQVAAVDVPPELLIGYHDAVHAAVVDYLRGVTDVDLDRVVDERWDPPVTLAVRLVSVVNDTTQHVGQAAFVKGVLQRR